MRRLMRGIVDWPRATLAAVVLVTLALGTQISHLEIDTSVDALMVEGDPQRVYYEQVKKKFGSDELTIVLVTADDVFTVPVLRAIRHLSEAVGRLPGVVRVESLTTVNNIKGEEDWLNTEPLIAAEIPTDPDAIQGIRSDALRNPIFVGNIVAGDARATAILVYTDTDPADTHANRTLAAAIEGLIRDELARAGNDIEGISQIGGPFTKVTMADFIQSDQLTLTPLALLVLLGVLYAMFRMAHAVVIPILTSVISIVWTLGLMAILGYQVNVLTAAIPALLVCIGFTEDVHLISEYHHALERGTDKLGALHSMMDAMAVPISVTSLTTIVGFGSMSLTGITMLVQLGHITPIAFFSNFLITIIVVPGVLRYWPVPRRLQQAHQAQEPSGDPVARFMHRIAEFNARRGGAVLVGMTLLSVVGAAGMLTLRVDSDLISYFREGSVIRSRMQQLHDRLAGILVFYLVIETDEEDAIKDPELLEQIAGLQEFVNRQDGIDTTVSVVDYVTTMHREMNAGDPGFAVVPDDRNLVAQYLLMLDGNDLAKYVDYGYATANILVRHNLSSSWALHALFRRIEDYVAAHFSPDVRVRYTGESVLINNASDSMARNLVVGLSYTVTIVAVINGILFLSVKAALLSLIPNIVPVIWVLAIMGILGVPLNAGTAMLAAIAVGIAVDDTVHYMCRNNVELNQHHDQRTAMFKTLEAEGGAIATTSLALAGGFGVLAFSNFVPTAQLGAMSAVVFILALAVDLTITPILMMRTRLVTLWHIVSLKMNMDLVKTAPLFRNMSPWEARKVVLLGILESLETGAHAIRRGEMGGEMFMVVTGRLHVSVARDGRDQVVATLKPGDVFGEMALVDSHERSADVVAESPAEVLRLDAPSLDRLRRRFPFTGVKLFQNLARILSERLRTTTQAALRPGEAS